MGEVGEDEDDVREVGGMVYEVVEGFEVVVIFVGVVIDV